VRPAAARSSYVLSLGRLNWKKGLDRLVRAMAYVPGVDLLIAGNDEENYQPRLEAMVRDLNMSSRVRFLGRCVAREMGPHQIGECVCTPLIFGEFRHRGA